MKSKLLIICLLLLALCSISSVAAQDANNQTDIFQNNNEAIRLYTKLGFKEISFRERYYDEDTALIMEKVK